MNILQALIQTKNNIQDWVIENLTGKVDKEDGKGLSSNDFTTAEKEKIAKLDGEFQKYLPLTGGTINGNLNVLGDILSNSKTLATTNYVDTAIEEAIGAIAVYDGSVS